MRKRAAGLVALLWASVALAGGHEAEGQFSFTPEAFGAAFDRQAAHDGTDRISQCVEVHRVSDCRFQMAAFKHAAPAEAAALSATGGEMADESFEFLRFDNWRIGGIDFYGSGSTPARRAHFVRQFKTLMRVLQPRIRGAEIEEIVDGLGLRSAPKQAGQEMRVALAFAFIACKQGGAGASSIRCSIEPAKP